MNKRFSIVKAVCKVTFLVFFSAPVIADNVLEEIFVTAQKREQNLQKVGIAITAFSGEQIKSFGLDSSTEIVEMTPGVHVGGSLAGQTLQYTIRGVAQNDFSDHTESPVATYIDDTYILAAQGQKFAMFDLERVEVLKGPQGTLFGRNATGGLVHFITRKPTNETSGYLDLEYGDYDQVKVESAVGASLTDSINYRIAGLYSSNNSYLDNDYNPALPESFMPSAAAVATGSGDDFGAETNVALRAHLQFKLNENADLLLSTNWADVEMSSAPYQSEPTAPIIDAQGRQRNAIAQPANSIAQAFSFETGAEILTGVFGPFPRPIPGSDSTGYIDPDGRELDTTSSSFAYEDLNTIESWGASAKLEWDLGRATFLSITDYKDFDKTFGMDVDAAPQNQLSFFAEAEISQFTQEFRIQGESNNLRWVTGFYYMHGEYDNNTGFKVLDNGQFLLPPGTLPADYPARVDQEVDSYSLFGQIDYDLNDKLTLTAGLRIIEEEKEFDYALVIRGISSDPKKWANGVEYGVFSDVVGFPVSTAFEDDASDTLWTGKVQLDWQLSEDLLLYAGINRGVKAGGFNAPIDFGGTQAQPGFEYEYDEEILFAYEAGFKATLFDGTTRLNGSFYYYDYKDYQGFVFAGVSGVVVNYDSTVVGAELELVTSPLDGLDIILGLGAFDAEVSDVEVASGVFEDTEPSFAPALTYNGLIRYSWEIFSGDELAVQGSFSYTDDFFYTLRNYDSHKMEDYTLFNARLSYTSVDKGWEAAIFVENLTDEDYPVTGFDISLFCGCSEIAVGKPRWWGLSLRRNF